MKKLNKVLLLSLYLLTFTLLLNCSKDDETTNDSNSTEETKNGGIKPDEPMAPNIVNTTNEDPLPNSEEIIDSNNSETPIKATSNTSLTDEIDRALFKQIKGHYEFYKKGTCFEDFAFSKYPLYLIQSSGGLFNSTQDAVKAYIINPKNITDEMKKVGDNESFGVNVYRYDKIMKKVFEDLKKGNGLFDFDYDINGSKYYVQSYYRGSVLGLNNTSAITTITHEAFHDMHQTQGPQNPNWQFSFNWIQDTSNYPFTKELVELQILVSEIFTDYPNIVDNELILQKLKQYVAIRSKEMEIDPTSRKLIKNMALEQERIEGGAYFAEMCGKRDYFKTNEKFYGFVYGIPMKAETSEELKEMLNFGTFYPAGASVLYSISKLDKERLKEYNTKTPFQIASDMLKMSEEEKAKALEKAKTSVNWAAIQKKAADLTSLEK